MSPRSRLATGPIKGYMAIRTDPIERDYPYEVGQSYELPEGQPLRMYQSGFHFFEVPTQLNRRTQDSWDQVQYIEIVAWETDLSEYKYSIARKIQVVRIIPKDEWDHLSGIWIAHYGTVHIVNCAFHREDGPAIEKVNGDKRWYRNGHLHREDGPAKEYAVGTKAWYRNGQLHRDDGPAMERWDGYEAWYRNGQLHREDGPAVEYADGDREWWINGACGTREWWIGAQIRDGSLEGANNSSPSVPEA